MNDCQHEQTPDKQGMYICKHCGISMEKIIQNRKDYEALTESSRVFFTLFREAREEIATETGYHLEHAIRRAFDKYSNSEFFKSHKVEVIFDSSQQYLCFIDYKEGDGAYGLGTTFIEAVNNGIYQYNKK